MLKFELEAVFDAWDPRTVDATQHKWDRN